MSNLKIIEELCGILHDMADIIQEQQKLLMEHDAVSLVEETARVKRRYTDLLGAEEWPDGPGDGTEGVT